MNHNKLRRTVITSLFVVVGFALLFYVHYQSKDFIGGPEIEIISPQNGELFNKPLVFIEGKATNIAHLELNGRQIFVNENNIFNEKLLLLDGYNIITIKAVDRFDREVQKELELVLIEDPSIISTLDEKPDKSLNEAVLEEIIEENDQEENIE